MVTMIGKGHPASKTQQGRNNFDGRDNGSKTVIFKTSPPYHAVVVGHHGEHMKVFDICRRAPL